MQARIARLEVSVPHIERGMTYLRIKLRDLRGEVGDQRETLAKIEEGLFHLPMTFGLSWSGVVQFLAIAMLFIAVIQLKG